MWDPAVLHGTIFFRADSYTVVIQTFKSGNCVYKRNYKIYRDNLITRSVKS